MGLTIVIIIIAAAFFGGFYILIKSEKKQHNEWDRIDSLIESIYARAENEYKLEELKALLKESEIKLEGLTTNRSMSLKYTSLHYFIRGKIDFAEKIESQNS